MLNELSIRKDKISYILFMLSFVCLAFVSYFISNNYNYIPSIIFVVGSLCLLAFKLKIKGDFVVVLLLLRSLISLINYAVLGLSFGAYFGQEKCAWIGILVYVFAKNCLSEEKSEIGNIMTAVALLTSLQVIITTIAYAGDKNYIGSAIGMSNYAATFLLMAITYFMFTKTDIVQKIIGVIALIAFILTQSFGGYIAFAVIFIIFAIMKFNWKSKWTYISIVGVIAVVALVFIVALKTGIGGSVVNKVLDKIGYLLSGNLKDFSSSRTELYAFTWQNICNNIFFGNVVNVNYSMPTDYRFQGFRTHNFLFESLLLYGIVGTLIAVAIIVVIVWKTVKGEKKWYKSPTKWVSFLMILVGFIHGLIEPNLFTFNYSMFFWLAVGMFVSEKPQVKIARLDKAEGKKWLKQ